jgi:hypothetical protein
MIKNIIICIIFLNIMQCSSITYKIIRKQNINNLESYKETDTNNQYFLLNLLPKERNNYVYSVCKNEEKNKIDFEIKNNSPEAYPSIINTRYNFISAPFNLIFGTLISTRKIYVYCPY